MTNREILFRGKYCGKWVYGWYFEEDGDSLIRENDMISSVVARSTVGQYTGLVDRNGTKIFKGDILRDSVFAQNEYYFVDYNQKYACFDLYYMENGIKTLSPLEMCGVWRMEVIGNIYDNPELLEEPKGGTDNE
jgi:uncharacterized phage protein (TIGR01671 family)